MRLNGGFPTPSHLTGKRGILSFKENNLLALPVKVAASLE
jgi:hypothetical protein